MEYGENGLGIVSNANGKGLLGEQFEEPKKSKSWLVILLSVVGVLVVAMIIAIVCIVIFSSDEHKQKSVKGTVGLFFESIEDYDYDKYLSIVPEYWQEHLRASKDSILGNHLKGYVNDHNAGDGDKLKFEITDIREMNPIKFLDVKSDFENWYDVEGEIEEFVYLDIVVKDDDGNEWTYTDFKLIKIDGKWYLGYGYIG